MSDENQTQAQNPQQNQLDPAFFTCVNEYLELTNKQSQQQGLKRISMASMYAASRFNAHVYLANVSDPAGERKEFLDYMTTMYRRMLNENLDGLGAERGVNVGESELAAEYAAAGVKLTTGVATFEEPSKG
jgi:phage terminase Nu1 subunit (DNA packaging protein)